VNARRTRVLVPDDDLVSRESLAYLLKALGYSRAVEDEVEMVILDPQLPEAEGVEVLAMIRDRMRPASVRVIALTRDDAGVNQFIETDARDLSPHRPFIKARERTCEAPSA